MERHPVGMLLLQAIPHCRFGQVLLGGFGGLKHGAYVCYVFLDSKQHWLFATKLALMFLEPFFPPLHCWWRQELLTVERSAPSPKCLQRKS